MKSSGTTLDLSPATVDAPNGRVLLRCYTCRRIRQELTTERLMHLMRHPRDHGCDFRCKDCDRTTAFPKGCIPQWLDEIHRVRARTMNKWDDWRTYENLRPEFRVSYHPPDFFRGIVS